MSGLWVQVECDLHDHPRLLALAEALDVEDVTATGWLVRLWSYALRHAVTSRVTVTRDALERVLGWRGEAGRLVESLVSTGWLAPVEGGYQVHGWERYDERAEAAERRKMANRERQRRSRERRREESVTRESRVTSRAESVTVTGPEAEAEAEAYNHSPTESDARTRATPSGPARSDVDQVIGHYRQCGHPHVRTGSRSARSMITARLREGRSVAELCRVLDAMHADEWSQQHGALSLERAMRNDERVSRWLDEADRQASHGPRQWPPGPGPGGGQRARLSRVQERLLRAQGGTPEPDQPRLVPLALPEVTDAA